MKANLLLPTGAYDRAAVMKDAHRQFRLMGAHGWTFGRCLSFAWARAKGQHVVHARHADRIAFLAMASLLDHARHNQAAA